MYGNSNDDHVLPDGQRKTMDVDMNDIRNKTTPLLGNEEDVEEEESLLGDVDDNNDNNDNEGETRRKRRRN